MKDISEDSQLLDKSKECAISGNYDDAIDYARKIKNASVSIKMELLVIEYEKLKNTD